MIIPPQPISNSPVVSVWEAWVLRGPALQWLFVAVLLLFGAGGSEPSSAARVELRSCFAAAGKAVVLATEHDTKSSVWKEHVFHPDQAVGPGIEGSISVVPRQSKGTLSGAGSWFSVVDLANARGRAPPLRG